MKAIAVTPGTKAVRLVDRPEPTLAFPKDVKLRTLRVGICGTDREEAAGGRALAPKDQTELVLGHEMFGQVVAVGREVTRVKPGDYAVLTVRRGCRQCLPCGMSRSDMCRTGQFVERGIWGLDGFQAEFVVDREQYLVPVPPELEPVGVLTEPLSVVEKAIDEAVRVQLARLPAAAASPNWLHGRRCLVAGLGPIGLLGAMILRLRGAEVFGLDVVHPKSIRPQWLQRIGGRYVEGRKEPAENVAETIGPVTLILEATGIAELEFNLFDALGPNGAYVLTGLPGGERPIPVPGAQLLRQLVLRNQVVIGSVNAARGHYQMAVSDLAQARLRWGDHIDQLITHRHSFHDFEAPLRQHSSEEIKSVVEWAQPRQTAGKDI